MSVIDKKRIAKNTLALYLRMAFSLLVALYTSRVVLEVLGVEDYGVYNAVGGVVALLSFLNSSMSSATSRFLTFEIGRGNAGAVAKTFSASFIIHCCIAILMLLLLETGGVWFLNNKLVIPHESMEAANWVLQFSILSCAISVTQVPYTAMIIAEERMNVYAYVEILNVCLKLLIVWLLWIMPLNKLFLYSLLLLSVTVIITIIYRAYCVNKFSVCKLHIIKDWNFYKPMLSFSGWDLYGNASVVARTQGINILLNLFFGPVANAAAGIGASVQGAVSSFSNNVVTAVRPQIIKSYAVGEFEGMQKLIFSSCKLIYCLILIVSMPVLLETDFILNLWLVDVPQFTVGITRLTILFIFFSTLSFIVVTGLHAAGHIRRPSIINGSIYLSVLPITYVAFKFFHDSIYIPFLLNVVFVIAGTFINLFSLKRYVPIINIHLFFTSVFLRCVGGSLLIVILPELIKAWLAPSGLRFILVSLCCIVCSIFVSYFVICSAKERELIRLFYSRTKYKLLKQ